MSKALKMIEETLRRREARRQHPQRRAQSDELRLEASKEHFKQFPVHSIHVYRQELTRDGYTRYGRYFGVGEPLFAIADPAGNVLKYIRATNKREAVDIAREHFPNAKVS